MNIEAEKKSQLKAYKAAWYAANKKQVVARRKANKESVAAYRAEYYATNKTRIAETSATYRAANKERLAAQRAAYKAANKERIAAQQLAYSIANKERLAEYRETHKEHRAAYKALYYAANKERVAAYKAARLKSDLNFKLRVALSHRARNALKLQHAKKTFQSHIKLLGCTVDQARTHIEKQFQPWMTWENHGARGWHIDHIRPLASFDLRDPAQVKQAFHFTNLRPLHWRENIQKGARLIT